jgi:hypothetical protein
MTHEKEFIKQFKAEIPRVHNGIQKRWCTSLFYDVLFPRLKSYLSGRDIIYVTRDPTLYIVLQRDNNIDIHFEIYLDSGTAFYAVFDHTDTLEANSGTVKEVLEYVIDALDPKPVVFTGTQNDIQKVMEWAEENLKI